jgi:hypothetical protein
MDVNEVKQQNQTQKPIKKKIVKQKSKAIRDAIQRRYEEH